MAGRRKQSTNYMNSKLKAVKNVGTRRTSVAIAHRDIKKLASAKKNKRVK